MWKQISTLSALALAFSATTALAQDLNPNVPPADQQIQRDGTMQVPDSTPTAPDLNRETPPPSAADLGPAVAVQDCGAPVDLSRQSPTEPAEIGDPTGLDVYGAECQKIGVVASASINPAMDENSIARFDTIWVETGSELGIGEKTVMLSADQFTRTEDGYVQLNLSAEQVAQMPHSEPR